MSTQPSTVLHNAVLFGHVTVCRLSQKLPNHADLYHFYPVGSPPYLDNVDECLDVYISTRKEPVDRTPQSRQNDLLNPLTAEQAADFIRREKQYVARVKEAQGKWQSAGNSPDVKDAAGFAPACSDTVDASIDEVRRVVGATPHAVVSICNELEKLHRILTESYSVIEALAAEAGRAEDPAVRKALDNIRLCDLEHTDVLPLPPSGEPGARDLLNQISRKMDSFDQEFSNVRNGAEEAKELPPGRWYYEPNGQTVWNEEASYMVCDIRGWGHLQYLTNGAQLQDATGRHLANLSPERVLQIFRDIESVRKDVSSLCEKFFPSSNPSF